MRVAALVGLLAAVPATAAEPVTPAQARASVVAALPPDIAKNAGTGDLQRYLERLPPEQRQAALRSLTAKEGELGDDPATLAVIGQAYAGLGNIRKVREVAQEALRQNPNHPDANRLLGWVTSQERLAERGSPAGGFAGDAAGPGSGGQTRLQSAQARLNAFEARVQNFFRRGNNSPEFRSTLQDARGVSVAELKEAGIRFQQAPADQRDAVMITRDGDAMTISIRQDAMASGGDTEARGAAHVANGVRQAQTLRDHEYIGRALIWARGWMSGAKVHKELAPNDIDRRPTAAADQELMTARKLLDQKTDQFDPSRESYGSVADQYLPMMNNFSKILALEKLFERFASSTGRNN